MEVDRMTLNDLLNRHYETVLGHYRDNSITPVKKLDQIEEGATVLIQDSKDDSLFYIIEVGNLERVKKSVVLSGFGMKGVYQVNGCPHMNPISSDIENLQHKITNYTLKQNRVYLL